MINKKQLMNAIESANVSQKKIKQNNLTFFTPYENKKKIVKLTNITKTYGFKQKKNYIFNHFNLTIYEGDVIGLVGPNGSGKSTLIELIGQIIDANDGKITYDLDYVIEPQEKIGIQFQQSTYPIGLTVSDVIDFVIEAYKIKISDSELDEMLTIFGLKSNLKTFAHSLSGGQQQRLNVLLSIMNKPQLLLLDELTTGLDIVSQKIIIEYLQNYIVKNNVTCILASHNIQELMAMTNRIILIKNGVIYVDAAYDKLIEKYEDLEHFFNLYLE